MQEKIDTFKNMLREVTAQTIDELISNPDWGKITFEEGKPALNKLYTLCKSFIDLPLDPLPTDSIDPLITQLKPIYETIQKIQSFNIETEPNPNDRKNQLIQSLTINTDTFYKSSHIFIPYLAYLTGDFQKNVDENKRAIDVFRESFSIHEKNIDARNKTLDSIIHAAREASAEAGVAHFTTDFSDAATLAKKASKKWLWATIVFSLFTLFTSAYFLKTNVELSTIAQAIQYVSSKIIILVFLITATLWCGNIYKVTKHREVVNKFKANSLKTFQAFIKATDDTAVKDAVLMETTRAIFREGTTGYISDASDNSGDGAKIVEIIRNSTQTAAAVKN